MHIVVVKVSLLWKTLIAMWQTLSRSKLFSTRTLIIVPLSLLWMPWHQFELDVWSWLLAGFRVRDIKYLSVGFIFRISEVKISADFGSAQNIQLLHGFFTSTELLALAGVDSLVLVGRKIDRGKTRSSLVVVRDYCSLSVRAQRCYLSNSFFICSLEVGFLPFLSSSTLAMQDCCFICLGKTRHVCSEREGNDQWRLSEGFHWWTYVNWQGAICLSCRRTNLFRKTFSSSFNISSIGFKNLVHQQ